LASFGVAFGFAKQSRAVSICEKNAAEVGAVCNSDTIVLESPVSSTISDELRCSGKNIVCIALLLNIADDFVYVIENRLQWVCLFISVIVWV
jgi:hypothetical protein